MNHIKRTHKTILGFTTLAFLGLAIAKYNTAHAEHAEQAGIPSEKEVSVIVAQHQEIQVWNSFSGRLTAVESSIIRPQVSGRITEIHFEDGQNVNEGDILLEIDPRPYKAALNKAKAAVSSAKSEDILAARELKRAEKLLAENAVAQRIYDERLNTAQQAKNNVLAANAQLTQAQVNLDYALVKAPISGKISRAELTKGNLVQAGPNAPILTTIVSNKEVYAEFEVDEKTYIKHVHAQALNKDAVKAIPVKLTVGSKDTAYMGHIHSFDNQINPETGTIRARALIKNVNGLLLPGMYADIKMANPEELKTILVPTTAIGTDQNRKFVYVVNEDNRVTYRQVKLGKKLDAGIVITSGLQNGDRIIAKDIGKTRSGEIVKYEDPKKAEETSAL